MTAEERIAKQPVQYWLAEVDQHGNARLVDGAHADRTGADKAKHLFDSLGLGWGKTYAVARVELTPVQPYTGAVNEEAIQTLNAAKKPAHSICPMPCRTKERIAACVYSCPKHP